MNIIFYLANALVMPPAIFFAANFYIFKREEVKFRSLWISVSILFLTAVVTSLQFIFPDIITALERNWQALLSGQIWRLISPLFIQPAGIWQCLFNGLFFIAFMPVAERLYSRGLILIYFGTGIIGQMVNFYWGTTPGGLSAGTGGSSTALYGVLGSLLMYILINRRVFPIGYVVIPLAGFLGAILLVFFEDGHAPALLAGGILGLILRGSSGKISPYPQRKNSESPVVGFTVDRMSGK